MICTTTPPASPSPVPAWSHRGEGATSTDPVGCRGVVVPGHLLCLAHLGASDRIGYLTTLSPGDDIDHPGTTFSSTLLDELRNALSDRATSRPRLGAALFHGAAFATAEFIGATFSSTARFDEVTFSVAAGFEGAEFSAQVGFEEVTFAGIAGFNDATFSADADLSGSLFSTAAQLGPLVCFGRLDLSSTVFAVPVTSEAAAMSVVCTDPVGGNRDAASAARHRIDPGWQTVGL